MSYNTVIVLLGATTFGVVSGFIGLFLLLRRRALLADTVSHAALPGIGLAFLFGHFLWGTGRSLPLLLAGAAVSGVVAVMLLAWMRQSGKVREDAALAILLGVFFGVGVVILTICQQLPGGNAAGLDHFIFGRVSAMTSADLWFTAILSLAVGMLGLLFFKEFAALSFDPEYAAIRGLPVSVLDLLLMLVAVAITITGLQTVGLLLVVAMLIIPPVAARFWTDRLGVSAALGALFGGLSAALGVALSATAPRLATGAIIVLTAGVFFILSFLFGGKRGLVARWLAHRRSTAALERQHLLRAIYELTEMPGREPTSAVGLSEIEAKRNWPCRQVRRFLNRALEEGMLAQGVDVNTYRLTASGRLAARNAVRSHRLWEIYLMHYAGVGAGEVDRDADTIEHILDPRVLGELEDLVAAQAGRDLVPNNPHAGWREGEKHVD